MLILILNSSFYDSKSNVTKRLVTKCRKLQLENDEMGKMLSSGNVSNLEADIAYHKHLLNEANQNEQGK